MKKGLASLDVLECGMINCGFVHGYCPPTVIDKTPKTKYGATARTGVDDGYGKDSLVYNAKRGQKVACRTHLLIHKALTLYLCRVHSQNVLE